MVEKIYLTCKFALHPTRRKAAALERVRATAETVFWQIVDLAREPADVIASEQDAKARRTEWNNEQKRLRSRIIVASLKARLAEPAVEGLIRDVTTAIGSYIQLRVNGC